MMMMKVDQGVVVMVMVVVYTHAYIYHDTLKKGPPKLPRMYVHPPTHITPCAMRKRKRNMDRKGKVYVVLFFFSSTPGRRFKTNVACLDVLVRPPASLGSQSGPRRHTASPCRPTAPSQCCRFPRPRSHRAAGFLSVGPGSLV